MIKKQDKPLPEEHFSGYILRKNVPKQDTVITFAKAVRAYLFPVVPDEEHFCEEQRWQLYQIERQLHNIIKDVCSFCPCDVKSMVKHFIDELPLIRQQLIEDARAILATDPAAYSLEEIIITYPGFAATLAYRIAHRLYLSKLPIVPRMISEWAHSKTGIDINPGATIGVPFIIDHGTGIVIGETCIIGKHVRIYQGVTLGAMVVDKEITGKRHPTIADHVVLYANCTILGGDTFIGEHAIVGGNCFITQSLAPHHIAYHTPGVSVKQLIKN